MDKTTIIHLKDISKISPLRHLQDIFNETSVIHRLQGIFLTYFNNSSVNHLVYRLALASKQSPVQN